jgi:hypothetical protein
MAFIIKNLYKPYAKVSTSTGATGSIAVVKQYNTGTSNLSGAPTVVGMVLGPYTKVVWQNNLESNTINNASASESMYAVNNVVTSLKISTSS